MSQLSLLNLTLREFSARLASDSPTPGGGAAAALTGALAAALGEMVAALTVGKQKFAAVEGDIRAAQERLARRRSLLEQLVDEDAAAYGELGAALKMPKDVPTRAGQVADAARLAAFVPLEVVAICRGVLEDAELLRRIGNPNLAADVAASAALASGAMSAAAANARANLPFLGAGRATIESELSRLLAAAPEFPSA